MSRISLPASALSCVLASATLIAAAPPAFAAQAPAEAGGNQVVRYDPDYFKAFQVSTAFDMVNHVPGFVFNSGEYARGFAGTAGNVLIDGQRPATKADLGNTLSNINADQVDHLDLIIGGAPGIDMHGQREIVNIVRKTGAKPSLSLLAIVRGMAPHAVRGVLLANFNESHGAYSTDLSADVFNFFDNGANNAHRLTRAPNQPDQPLFIAQHAGGEGMESSGQHSMPLLGGKLSVNGTYNPSVYRSDASYIGDTTAHESFTDKDTPSELGGQFERKFKNGIGADFNVLDRYEREHQIDVYTDPSGVSDYRALIMSRERIASGRLSWEKSKGLTFTLGSESAFNSRDEVSSFTQNAVPVGLPVSSVRVQEDRNESFASVNWQALPKLSLEGELKVENSTISVPQDNRADSFTYYKPRFQAVYSLTDKTKLSWKSVRQVDQLSFGQFASSIQLQTNQVTLGNTALVPQKKWMNSLILDHTFWDKGALSLAYEHYDIQDTSDYIAVIDGGNIYNAAGNAGDAKGDILHLKLDMPLDRLKVKNGLLNVDWTYRQTRVKDPITGLDRYISGQRPHNYSVSFSQDFPAHSMKWGIDVQSVNDYRNYLANELSWSRWAPWFQTWVEYKTPSKLTFRLTLRNPESLQFTNDRVVYEGLREKSPVAYTQHTTSHIPPIIEIKVKKDL